MYKRTLFFNRLFIVFLVGISCGTFAQDSKSDVKAVSIEDWETGDFSQFDWQFEGNADWSITDINPYEGIYAAQSMDIGDNQSSALFLEYNVYAEDTLSFWFKVSSEDNYDFLRFYIDGEEINAWDGEIQWSYFEYVVPVGTHILKWEYEKDFSVSNGQDAAWVDFITFPPEEVEAFFIADTTVICQGDIVNYTDLSIGPLTEWSWYFEGGIPMTSTEQNPAVEYPNLGSWDVFLEVTDGIETAQYSIDEYIIVSTSPSIANPPVGISNLCASWGNTTTYSTVPMGGDVATYDWTLSLPEAGSISGNDGTNITVIWEPDFLGTVDLQVAGINYCGIGVYSNPLTITRYLPDVSVMLPAYVALPEPPFELTGGTPDGGEYSGPGVTNGWFDPATAGMGPHTITYTYTDLNMCTNSATDVITVTEFIGIIENLQDNEVRLFPNPGNGNFVLQVNVKTENNFDVKIYNTINEIVFSEENIPLGIGIEKKFNLDLSEGVYFVKISGNKSEFVKKIVVQN